VIWSEGIILWLIEEDVHLTLDEGAYYRNVAGCRARQPLAVAWRQLNIAYQQWQHRLFVTAAAAARAIVAARTCAL